MALIQINTADARDVKTLSEEAAQSAGPSVKDDAESGVVQGNTVTFSRPVGGWPSLEQLIREHPEAFMVSAGLDDYGPTCRFCGNVSAVCQCDR